MKRGNKKVITLIVIILSGLVISIGIYFSIKTSIKKSPPMDLEEEISKDLPENYCGIGYKPKQVECDLKLEGWFPKWDPKSGDRSVKCRSVKTDEITNEYNYIGTFIGCTCYYEDPKPSCTNKHKRYKEPKRENGEPIFPNNECKIKFEHSFDIKFVVNGPTHVLCKKAALDECEKLCGEVIPTDIDLKKAPGEISCCVPPLELV